MQMAGLRNCMSPHGRDGCWVMAWTRAEAARHRGVRGPRLFGLNICCMQAGGLRASSLHGLQTVIIKQLEVGKKR